MWNLCPLSSLEYKDITSFSLLLGMSGISQSIQTRITDMMIDWLDVFNRRSAQGAMSKEKMMIGVYNDDDIQLVDSFLQIQTRRVTEADLVAFFDEHKSLYDPLLGYIYMRKAILKVSKRPSRPRRVGSIARRACGWRAR